MSDTLAHVLPLALGAAVSPTILTIGILILAGQHGRLRMAIFTACNIGLMVVLAIVGLKVFSHAVTTNSSESMQSISATVDIVLGVVLLLLGVKMWIHGDSEKTEKPKETDSGLHPLRYALLGVAFTVTNFTTLVLYGPALKEIALAKLPSDEEILVTAILVAIATVTAWLPLVASVVAPKTATRILGDVKRFTTVHKRTISITVLFVFGAYLLWKGIAAG